MRNLLNFKYINYKALIKHVFFDRGIWMSKKTNFNDLKDFLNRFKEKFVSLELERIGNSEIDGGYLVPKNVMSTIKYCFSPGTGYDVSFELDLSNKYSIKSFMADGSVEGPPIFNENFNFSKVFLSSKIIEKSHVTLSHWIKNCLANPNQINAGEGGGGIILQMDIEENEYEVLTYETSETLKKFSVIIIEFHALQNIFERHFFQMIKAIFEKIYDNFHICHAHPNNNDRMTVINGIEIPNILEITFVRNDFVDKSNLNVAKKFPHALDKKNNKNFSDIVLPSSWYKD